MIDDRDEDNDDDILSLAAHFKMPVCAVLQEKVYIKPQGSKK